MSDYCTVFLYSNTVNELLDVSVTVHSCLE